MCKVAPPVPRLPQAYTAKLPYKVVQQKNQTAIDTWCRGVLPNCTAAIQGADLYAIDVSFDFGSLISYPSEESQLLYEAAVRARAPRGPHAWG